MRRYSAGAGRLLTQPIRWNSTTETLLKAPQEPVDPPSLPGTIVSCILPIFLTTWDS
ncbi:hypothetical protein C8R44DRAFT_800841 [Mycena epipterygia]|nr:hypothetical protein C8R44DRAFT_800841 [Mycena epipterygia]